MTPFLYLSELDLNDVLGFLFLAFSLMLLFAFIFYFYFFLRFYLFIHDRHRERERGRDTGRGRSRGRSRLHAGSLTWDSILGIQNLQPWAEGGAKPLSHWGCPGFGFLWPTQSAIAQTPLDKPWNFRNTKFL